MGDVHEENLSALLHETRSFPPPEELAKEANAQPGIYAEADGDRLAFWEAQAQRLRWETPWSDVVDWRIPFAKWFVGGTLNVAVNCVDRHVESGLGGASPSTGKESQATRGRSPTPISSPRCARPPTR